MKKFVSILPMGLILLAGLFVVEGTAQVTPPGLKATLLLDKTNYLATEPIKIDLTLQNISGEVIWTTRGFSAKPFHLFFFFIDPDGKGIQATELGGGATSVPPPIVTPFQNAGGDIVMVQVDPVESLAADFLNTMSLPDGKAYYLLNKIGRYSVKAVIPMRSYPSSVVFQTNETGFVAPLDSFNFAGAVESNIVNFSIIADTDGDGYFSDVDCDDQNPDVNPGAVEIPGNGIDDDCNPATPDVVALTAGTISVTADKHTVGSGNHPGSTKAPIPGLPVRVFDKSAGSCVSRFGVSWQNYKSIWLSCSPQTDGVTNTAGTANIATPPGDYVLIGKYDPDGTQENDELYIGVSVGALAPGQTTQKYLQVIVKADGKKVPAKYTVKTGSELLIIEPEYVEWDGAQELYPFILESLGEWSVTTSLEPPYGFVTDVRNLSADVNTTTSALQFTVFNVGSDWVSTSVAHRITHQKKSEVVRTKIGVKLSERLARSKGLSRFGQEPPGRPVVLGTQTKPATGQSRKP